MRIPRCAPAVFLAVALAAAPAAATIVLRVTVEDLTDKATLIVKGEVLESKARWTEDGGTINTYVRVRVEGVLKGSAGEEISVTCFGGKVGEEKVQVSGVPKFAPGEKVFVFLWKDKAGNLLPLGLNQGKFRIERDPETGDEMARNSLKGLSFARLGERAKDPEARKKPDAFSLSELERRVRDRLDRGAEEEKKKKAPPEPDPKKPEPVEEKTPPPEDEPSPAEDTPPTPKKKPGEGSPPGRL